MDEFENLSLYEIFEWLDENNTWSKEWFTDELFPFIEHKFKPKTINDYKKEIGLSYANI